VAIIDLSRHLDYLGGLLAALGLSPSGAEFSSSTDTATLGRRDVYWCVDTSVPRTLTLSSADIAQATPEAPWFITIKDRTGGANANNITVASEGGELFDGAATAVISEDFGTLNLMVEGADAYGR